MKNWYSIQAKKNSAGEDVAEISIFEEIGMWGVSAKHFIADLKKVAASKITLSINSPGGSVFDALAIFNALQNSGKEVTVRVMGIAASAASYIAMAGKRIVMPENSFMMLHNPIGGIFGNADEMREMADVLDKIGASLTATYVKRSTKSEEEVKAILAKDSYLTAAECKELGFCDEVEPAIKASAQFEIDRLPENIQAVFKAAQQPEPVKKPSEATGTEMVVAEIKAAGFEKFSAVLALSCPSVEAVKARIEQIREIKALCDVAKSNEFESFVMASKSPDDVRKALVDAMAKQSDATAVDTSPRNPNSPPVHTQPRAVTTQGIWAARRNKSATKEA